LGDELVSLGFDGERLAQLVARERNSGDACDDKGHARAALPISCAGHGEHEPKPSADDNGLNCRKRIELSVFHELPLLLLVSLSFRAAAAIRATPDARRE
jgi:hypothetical protein